MTLWVSVPEDQLRPMIHLTPSGPRRAPEILLAPVLLIKRFVERKGQKKSPILYLQHMPHEN